MARRKLYWHIGPDDLGTVFLADALRAGSTELASHGVLVHDPAKPGTAAWARMEERIWKHKGVSVLSTPKLARAERDEIKLALAGLRDVEVHLILLVRDLPSQVHAAWQGQLEGGATTALEKYADRVLSPGREHAQAANFWAGHDLVTILGGRWTKAIHADRVHVIGVADAQHPSEAADTIWSAFLATAGVTGVARADVPLPWTIPGTVSIERARVEEITEGWAKFVADKGFDLQGTLSQGEPEDYVTTSQADRLALSVEGLATAAVEIARLRTRVSELEVTNSDLDRKRKKHKRRLAKLLERTQADLPGKTGTSPSE